MEGQGCGRNAEAFFRPECIIAIWISTQQTAIALLRFFALTCPVGGAGLPVQCTATFCRTWCGLGKRAQDLLGVFIVATLIGHPAEPPVRFTHQ